MQKRHKNIHLNQTDLKYHQTLKKVSRFLKNNFYLLISTIAVFLFIYFGINQWDVCYGDADGYMRAIRVNNWHNNPLFWEQKIYQSNYPFGEVNHWTRFVDILWLICSAPFFNQFALKDALFLGGAFLSPIVGIIAVSMLGYGLKRQFNIFLALLGCLFFMNMHQTQFEFSFYRADHHSVLMALGLYSMSNLMCYLKKHQNRYLFRLSLSLSLMTFTSIEAILITPIFLLYFIYQYVFKNNSLNPAYTIIKYYTIFIVIFFILNPPFEGYFYPDNGRLSILYITASTLTLIALKILCSQRIHTKRLKIVSLLCSASVIFLLLVLIFSKDILLPPLAPEIKTIWSNRIAEMKHFYDFPISSIINLYATSTIALLLNIILLLTSKRHKKLLILNLIIGLPLHALSLYATRFYIYQPIYIFIPFLCFIDKLYYSSDFHKRKSNEFPSVIYSACLIILLLEELISMPIILEHKPDNKSTYYSSLSQTIKLHQGTLLTDTFLSPRFVYECGVNTVSTPYHRNKEGIIDGYKILFSSDDYELIPLLLKHQITQIVLFENYGNKFYDLSEENKQKLYYRLIKRERIPPFLKEIPSIHSNVRHYKVSTL
ncbi:MAG: hypothetical protein E7005_06895 [Alphaproteobacteria bacterium]|nr:hypothetical protein [Alphaproteobacteria bacterium]